MRVTKIGTTSSARRLRRLLLAAGLAAVPAMAGQAAAQCASMVGDGTFEAQTRARVSSPWMQEGNAQIERGLGNSRGGDNNALLRGTTGWNAIRARVQLTAGRTYTLRAFVRTTGNVRDGYFGFRDAAQRPVREIKYGPLNGYRELRVAFRPTATGPYYVFGGVWAPGQDASVRVDDVRLDGPCEDVVLNPVGG
jgi:opacity protein-like surface antigen